MRVNKTNLDVAVEKIMADINQVKYLPEFQLELFKMYESETKLTQFIQNALDFKANLIFKESNKK